MFFFRQNKITFDAFITNSVVADLFPITKATKHYPEFWKELPNSYKTSENIQENPTMKLCSGFYDYYLNGFIVPLWADLLYQTNDDNFSWQFSNGEFSADSHNYKQREGFLRNYYHLKLVNPWMLKGKADIPWLNSQPTWNFNDDLAKIIIPPAVCEYQYQHTLNVNTFVPRLDGQNSYYLEAGQPLIHLAPMTDKRVDIKVQVIDQVEYNRIFAKHKPFKFINKYRSYKKFAKQNKCPFSS